MTAVRTPDGALPRPQSDHDDWAAGPSPETRRSIAGLPFCRQVSRIASLLFCQPVCGTIRATTLTARRPGAGAVPGRWGACLAVRTPPAVFFLRPDDQSSLRIVPKPRLLVNRPY